jgi:hypothetical protein
MYIHFHKTLKTDFVVLWWMYTRYTIVLYTYDDDIYFLLLIVWVNSIIINPSKILSLLLIIIHHYHHSSFLPSNFQFQFNNNPLLSFALIPQKASIFRFTSSFHQLLGVMNLFFLSLTFQNFSFDSDPFFIWSLRGNCSLLGFDLLIISFKSFFF